MNAPSIDIADILVAESALGLSLKSNLFIGREPAEPNDCVTVYDTPGFPPVLTLDQAEQAILERPSVQIRVRNRNYLTGWNLIHDITTALHGRGQETWNGTLYLLIKCESGPAMLDWDSNNRVRFIVNFYIQRR